MQKNIISEAVWLRAIACLIVVLCHSMETASTVLLLDESPDVARTKSILYIFYMATFFATPAFVFLSEFLISKKYSTQIPVGFIKKRIKYLLYPYLFMSVVYAFTDNDSLTLKSVAIESLRNIFLGESTVYFVLIIFQFYFLHLLFYKKLARWKPKVVLITTLGVNIGYLAIFNFLNSPNNTIAAYLWGRGHWVIFIGWIFYFALGYYAGKHYYYLKAKLNTKPALIILIFTSVAFLMIVLVTKYFKIIDAVSSKRIDIVFYTISIILLIFSVSTFINRTPRIIIMLSNYSFSIYLLHKVFLRLFEILDIFEEMNIVAFIVFTFILSLGVSIITSYLINITWFGKYLVGQNQQIKLNKPVRGTLKVV